MRFSKVVSAPARTLVIPPTAWSPTWSLRPKVDACCGLRLLSASASVAAERQAADAVLAEHKGDITEAAVNAYNDHLMRLVVAGGTCDPDDVTKPWALWKGAEETIVFLALTSQGARFVFDAIEALAIETSPVQREAEDSEIAALAYRFEKAKLSRADRARFRRLVGFAADMLGGR